ncbi:methylmalonyl-CoA mutase family protein [Ekhidna sp.]
MKELDLNVFPKIDRTGWENLAQKQLKGANPLHELSWKNDGGLDLERYYDESDLIELTYLSDFFTDLKPHRWKLYQRIASEDIKEANREALEALMGGCDGIIFDLTNSNKTDDLLKNIDEQICDLSFINNSLDSLPTKSVLFTDSNCIFEKKPHTSPITQLVELISSLESETFVHRKAFVDFFLEIASVRALRYLLNQKSMEVHIHTQIPKHESEEHQWFLNTTAGLASILGGSHSIDLTTHIGDSRISRNTGNLIREESGIKEYTDQCGGSYYIEVLTDKIIKEVVEKLK